MTLQPKCFRLLPDFSARAFMVGDPYKETTDQDHLSW
jgi:hypothetical protein